MFGLVYDTGMRINELTNLLENILKFIEILFKMECEIYVTNDYKKSIPQ